MATSSSSIENKAIKLGDLLNSWVKIIVVVGTAVISCALAYYKIFENEDDIKQVKEDVKRQWSIQEERSDKRYGRAMEEAKELKEFLKWQEIRIQELQKQVSFLEGQREAPRDK